MNFNRLGSFRLTLLGLVLSGLTVITAFALPWVTTTAPLVEGLSESLTNVTFTGRELLPLAAAMGWVGLAALAGIIAARGWGRVIVGFVVVAAGLVTAVGATGFGTNPRSLLSATLTGRIGSRDLGGVDLGQWSRTPWWALGLVGGLGLVVSGGLIVARGRTWPGLSRRYERSATAKSAATSGPISALSAWDALDRGEDPTT